jgi:Tol biopolymer transport system component
VAIASRTISIAPSSSIARAVNYACLLDSMSITTLANLTLRRLTQSAVVALTAALLSACGNSGSVSAPLTLNSRYTDEQPSLSGDGRMLAFVSNRDGDRKIFLFDLQQRRFIDLPRLNRRDAIAEQPSLSYTGRYLVYLASDYARPEIELYDRATGQVQVLSQGYRGWVRSPRISPDGRFVAFESGARGQWDIELLDRGVNTELDLPEGRSSSPPAPTSP